MAASGPYMGPNCHASAMARPGYTTAWVSPALDMAMLWRFAVFARDIILSAVAMHWLWHGKWISGILACQGCAVQATASHDKAWSGCDCHGHALALQGKAVACWATRLRGRQLAWGLFDHWLPVWGTVGMEAHHELIQ